MYDKFESVCDFFGKDTNTSSSSESSLDYSAAVVVSERTLTPRLCWPLRHQQQRRLGRKRKGGQEGQRRLVRCAGSRCRGCGGCCRRCGSLENHLYQYCIAS